VALGLLIAGLLTALAPAASRAAVSTFGSTLSVPATLNTAEDLEYLGTYTSVPPAPDAPNGVFHTHHYGADGVLWNVALANGEPRAPASGQVLKIALEGCAQPAARGPAPLTQIHFQALAPLHGGGAKISVTSQAFDIPVCGQNGASGSTVTTYEPTNLCVGQGDYVGFNDEGGYVPNAYPSGVPYRVLGSVPGSASDSFIRNHGTGNGTAMSPSDKTANDGFATNQDKELMLQATLGTGPDATFLCPGGTRNQYRRAGAVLPPIRVSPQTDGVNRSRVVSVAVYCRPVAGCQGVAALTALGRGASSIHGRAGLYGSTSFSLPGNKTSHVRIRVSSQVIQMIRKRSSGVSATLTAIVGAETFTQTIGLRIF
jgi:hypothetical protein